MVNAEDGAKSYENSEEEQKSFRPGDFKNGLMEKIVLSGSTLKDNAFHFY